MSEIDQIAAANSDHSPSRPGSRPVREESFSDSRNEAAYGAPGGRVPALYVGTDGLLRVQLFWSGTTNPISSAVAVNDGLFHHVAVTYESGTEVVYLDGVSIGSRALTQTNYADTYYYQLGTGVTVGWPGSGPSDWFTFNGLI